MQAPPQRSVRLPQRLAPVPCRPGGSLPRRLGRGHSRGGLAPQHRQGVQGRLRSGRGRRGGQVGGQDACQVQARCSTGCSVSSSTPAVRPQEEEPHPTPHPTHPTPAAMRTHVLTRAA